MPKRTVTNPTRIKGAQGEGLRVGCTRQIRRCTTHRTPTSERAVSARANPPTASAIRRFANEGVLVLEIAAANSPPIPAERAASPGSCPAAVEASPNPVTTTKAYGTKNMNRRKATAAASTPPPDWASRSTASNTVAIDAESWRRASIPALVRSARWRRCAT
jgi:hypothetical protein